MKKVLLLVCVFLLIGVAISGAFWIFNKNKKNSYENYEGTLDSIKVTNKDVEKRYISLKEARKNYIVSATMHLRGHTPELIEYSKKISFLRKTENYYYAVFQSDNSNFYIFWSNVNKHMVSSFFLNTNNNSEISNICKGETLENVKKADDCTLLTKTSGEFSSQHVLHNGNQYYFTYKKSDEGYVVDRIIENKGNCTIFISEILSMDLPN